VRSVTSSSLRVGIDFDNTIVAYDEVFCAAAKRLGLIGSSFVGHKQAVRDAIRLLSDGEFAWQRLQGEVYGKGITGATMFPGVGAFLRRCQTLGSEVVIVSHKTEYGHHDSDRVNLRKAALDWMAVQGLFDGAHALTPKDVYFENTREEKLGRIATLSLTHFIDDLEEVLTDPGFPPNVERILFAQDNQPSAAHFTVYPTWHEIERHLFIGASN